MALTRIISLDSAKKKELQRKLLISGERESFRRLMCDVYPSGILSLVSDSWDLWSILTEILPSLKTEIMSRDGKVVIRPDSGNPVDIICGTLSQEWKGEPSDLGVIELLWNEFGGIVNEAGYKVLDSHIGAIYGDSITLDRADQICKRLKDKGFASSNIVFGIGSYTFSYVTRDTLGLAMKATYCEVNGEGREIFKNPITDDGTKKSLKGLLKVYKEDGVLKVRDQVSWEEEAGGELQTVFEDGRLLKDFTLAEVRKTVLESL